MSYLSQQMAEKRTGIRIFSGINETQTAEKSNVMSLSCKVKQKANSVIVRTRKFDIKSNISYYNES